MRHDNAMTGTPNPFDPTLSPEERERAQREFNETIRKAGVAFSEACGNAGRAMREFFDAYEQAEGDGRGASEARFDAARWGRHFMCEYAGCRQDAVGHLNWHNMQMEEHPMCEKHMDPMMHPRDLRKNLVHWTPVDVCRDLIIESGRTD